MQGEGGLLPVRPRPFADELFSSWFMRLAHANTQRLPYFSFHMTGHHNFWTRDPDRSLRAEVARALSGATGLPLDTIVALTLRPLVGRVIPTLPPRSQVRWVTPLNKRGYLCERPGLSFCPACLREGLYLRQTWRLSFVGLCQHHGCLLLDACPACDAPYAPQRNDLGHGQDWSVQPEPPFGCCATCGADLRRGDASPGDAPLLALQGWMLQGADTGVLPWPGQGDVPVLEGFDVLHQLLTVALTRGMQVHLTGACGLLGLKQPSARPNRTFEDHILPDRRTLLQHLDFLLQGWPDQFVRTCQAAGLPKSPLVHHLHPVPAWYGAVADRLSRQGGRPPPQLGSLAAHLDLAGLTRERDGAPTPSERRRWTILWHYHQGPEVATVARRLGVSWDLVRRTVTRYNAQGPEGIREVKRGRPSPRKRLLTAEQEEELRLALTTTPMSYAEMADWVEARVGRRPNTTTLWIYRRGVDSHSREGRRATSG
ncbi:hypothetical protein GCM10025871_22060 [Deinococcus metallilatus]|nr:hypothetical protein GCM10025871_22060 [Deinococcus metallilatus]